MAYLTRRSSGYRFQIRIPRDLVPILGMSPIRINLGQLQRGLALRCARLLAGHVETVFIHLRSRTGTAKMDDLEIRDDLIVELERQVAFLLEQNELLSETVVVTQALAEQQLENAVLATENKLRADFISEMTVVKDGLAQSVQLLQAVKRSRSESSTGAVAKLQEQMDKLSAVVTTALNGGYDRPLLSTALEEWIELRSNLGIDPKKITTDKNRILDFAAFAGDLPVNKYTFFQFQRFASMLVFLPGNYMKKPIYKNKSQEQISEENKRRPVGNREAGLAAKTIDTNYLSPLRMFFRDVAAEHGFRSPLENVDIKISASATESVERSPLSVQDLNTWFSYAGGQKRADHKWLPLLATLTGARIGELIALQGKDVYLMASTAGEGVGHWVVDLRTEMVTEDGLKERRRIKNRTSRRLIALHQVFEELGFIDYVKTRKDDDWIFPAAFYHGKSLVERPADAASKRMNRVLEKLKIHKTLEVTFHSTRHTAKDFMRLAKVDERTHDKQTGHAFGTVSRNYGSRHLVGEELEVLSALPLPDGLDLSPYYQSSR